MTRVFVTDIQPQMQVDEVFRIADRQLRANRQGGLYLLMQLQDRTGTISGMRWNADERLAEIFNKGQYVRVQATSQLHNGMVQLIVTQMQSVDDRQINAEDFTDSTRVDVDTLWRNVGELIGKIANETVSSIALAFYRDPTIESAMRLAPAGIKAHHAYPGGLLEHVLSLMNLADFVSDHYPDLDRDIMLAGAFLHDIGKLEEMAFDGELSYTDAGQLLGHLVQGVGMLEGKVAQLKADGGSIENDKVLHLKHIIVSHHGCLEHGSPRIPMTLESMAFHYLDEMDAKLNSMRGMIEADRTSDRWTPYNPTLARKVLKPQKA